MRRWNVFVAVDTRNGWAYAGTVTVRDGFTAADAEARERAARVLAGDRAYTIRSAGYAFPGDPDYPAGR